jgi:peptidoglycan/LPS O-acetylase OafA/YrhL
VLIIHQDFWFLHGAKAFLSLDTLIVFFFVLSSFLITRILLASKKKSLEQGYGHTKTAFAFLIRRALRIFPAYYFYLILIMLMPNLGHYLRQHAAMFFFYLGNFRTYSDQIWEATSAHLWTLSIEEQFYVIWPWIILFVPQKFLPRVFYTMIAAGIVFRILFFVLHPASASETVSPSILTPASLDAFGLGGLLACWHGNGKTKNTFLPKLCWVILPFWVLLKIMQDHTLAAGLDKAYAALISMVLIEGASNGYRNHFGRILESRPVTYLGKISYGIYLYHLLVPIVFWRVFFAVAHRLPASMKPGYQILQEFLALPVVNFVAYFLITVLLASASWYFLELPINNLKRYIRYTSPNRNRKEKEPSVGLPTQP